VVWRSAPGSGLYGRRRIATIWTVVAGALSAVNLHFFWTAQHATTERLAYTPPRLLPGRHPVVVGGASRDNNDLIWTAEHTSLSPTLNNEFLTTGFTIENDVLMPKPESSTAYYNYSAPQSITTYAFTSSPSLFPLRNGRQQQFHGWTLLLAQM